MSWGADVKALKKSQFCHHDNYFSANGQGRFKVHRTALIVDGEYVCKEDILVDPEGYPDTVETNSSCDY